MVPRLWICIAALLLIGAAVLLLQDPPSSADPVSPSSDGLDPPSLPDLLHASETEADLTSNATVRSVSTAFPMLIGRLTGLVVGLDGRPVAGATVTPMCRRQPAGDPVTTDVAGRYQMTLPYGEVDDSGRLSPRTYRVQAEQGARVADQGRSVNVSPGAVVHYAPLVLVLPTIIAGRVRDSGGKPVAGASLTDAITGDRIAITGEGGRFEGVMRWDTDREVLLAVTAPGYVPAASPPGHVHPGDVWADIDLVLEPTVVVQGRVVDPADRPAPDVWVSVHVPDGRLTERHRWGATQQISTAATDEAGRFQVEVPAHGPFRVGAWTHFHAGVNVDVADVRFMERELVVPADTRVGTRVELSLVDAAGRIVTRLPERLHIRGDGCLIPVPGDVFSGDARGLPAGCLRVLVPHGSARPEMWIEASVPGYALARTPTFRPTLEGPLHFQLVLTSGGTVSGRVVDRGTGSPVIGAEVVVRGGADHAQVVATDFDGRFACSNLLDGEYRLRVAAPGHVSVEVPWVIAPEQRDTTLDLALDPGAFITGRVLRRDGQPVPRSEVRASAPEGLVHQVECDAGGAFVLGPLAAGTWLLDLPAGQEGPDARAATAVEVVTGERIHQDLHVADFDRVVVDGTITEAGSPVAGASLELIGEDAGYSADGDTLGRFSFPAVAPGTYRLTVREQDCDEIANRRLQVPPGQDLRLDLELDAAAVTVALERRPGASPAICQVHLLRYVPDPLLNEAFADEDDPWLLEVEPRYLVEGEERTIRRLAAGDYLLNVEWADAEGLVAAPRLFPLTPGEHRTLLLRLSPAAALRVALPGIANPWAYEVRLTRVGAPSHVISCELEEDGTASLDALAPGAWRLQVLWYGDGEEEEPPRIVHEQGVDLAEGAMLDLEIHTPAR